MITLLRDALDGLTRSQKILAIYLRQHPEKIVYLSIRELAESARASLATVFRPCRHLGYKGYVERGDEVQQSVQWRGFVTGQDFLIDGGAYPGTFWQLNA